MYELIITNKNYSSWSLRVWILMRHLGIAFTEKLLPYHPGAFKGVTPSGNVPCLVDGDLVLWDTLAIIEYLAERHAGVWPTDPRARAWARCAAAEMHSGFRALRNDCSMSVGVRIKRHSVSPALHADLARLAALWADGIQRHGGPFLCGTGFTAADAFFVPVASRVQTYGLPLPAAAANYCARLLDMDLMKEWVAAGLAETLRDPAHEEEILSQGMLLEDLRASAR